jgi:hypothetical protein
LLHHPLPWLEAQNAKEIRRTLLESSDIILTGHEHERSDLNTELVGVGRSSIFESAAFKLERGTGAEGYSVIYIDTDSKRQVKVDFVWQDQRFVPHQSGRQIDPSQPVLSLDFGQNQYRKNRKWTFSPEFDEQLKSPGLDILLQNGRELALPEIFVCPDIRELRAESNYEKSRPIGGDSAFSEIASKQHTVIIGADESGKTALSKMLTLFFRAEGLIPILLKGCDLSISPDRLKGVIGENADYQYGGQSAEQFFNSPLEDKVLIIDDYHHLGKSLRNEHQILDLASRFSGRVVLLCHDAELGQLDLGKFSLRENPKVSVMQLPPLTFERRARLIEKWVSLGQDEFSDSDGRLRKEAECHRLINAIIGNNFIQPYPPYLIAMLQSIEAGREVDISASTHGHLYEVFIKTALARRRTLTNHNIISTFVATLAIEVFETDQQEFGDDFLRVAHERFERETDIDRDLKSLIRDLVEVRLLRKVDGGYRFRENYIFYYFVAFYLKDRLAQSEARKIVVECASKAWIQDYANVLLFLAHLSKDEFIVNTILEVANRTFANSESVNLEGRISVYDAGGNVPLVLDEAHEQSENVKRRSQEDAANESQLSHCSYALKRDATISEVGLVGEFSAALKTLQVLGQLLKNFPASFSPERKVEMVNACVDLGLRTLGRYFEFVDVEKIPILREFSDVVRSRLPEARVEESLEKAGAALENLCHLAAFGVIKRISYAIGSSELEKTYSKVFDKNDTPARKLVRLSMDLDQAGEFPEVTIVNCYRSWGAHQFAQRVLRNLVVRHFRLFQRPFSVRQRLGQVIGISYQRTITPQSSKLIAELGLKEGSAKRAKTKKIKKRKR